MAAPRSGSAVWPVWMPALEGGVSSDGMGLGSKVTSELGSATDG